jgi:hypothetical protein
MGDHLSALTHLAKDKSKKQKQKAIGFIFSAVNPCPYDKKII